MAGAGDPQAVRYCHCGTRLARDNPRQQCHACQKAARNHRVRPPVVPPAFWQTSELRTALATRDMGVVMHAFRTHPGHGIAIRQEVAAAWVGLSQSRLSRIEKGGQAFTLPKLTRWAHILGIPDHLWWFGIPDASPQLRDGPDDLEVTWQRLCALIADLLQLASEVCFDGNRYLEAVHCYTMAATASKEANDFDLWACALTRHAFVAVHEYGFDRAGPLLDLASRLARQGDRSLSTRHWVAAVQAETFAGLGDLSACQRAMDVAEEVNRLDGEVQNGGWLRFDGSRLAEERGTCYVTLNRPDLADVPLTAALRQNLSVRRRSSVLTDMALAGLQRRDIPQVVTYSTAALDTVNQTGSGYAMRKLSGLQCRLTPLLDNRDIRDLHQQISTVIRQQGV